MSRIRIDKFRVFVSKQAAGLLVVALLIIVPLIIRVFVWLLPSSSPEPYHVKEEMVAQAEKKIRREITDLDRKLHAKRPRSYFLIINSSSNEFELFQGDQLIRKDICSTGSYILLIQGKTTFPVWKKPDWAFVEEGLPVPPSDHYSRFEYGVLGDYALSLGQGYLIHGTLYQRFLGLPVTHGCIRLNDENLELVYRTLQVGSKVYIY
jgi:L,D-transpeptidase ErfK/SrfK